MPILALQREIEMVNKGEFPPSRNEAPEPDPIVKEDPTENGKVALAVVAIAVVLGAIFYELNPTTYDRDGTYSQCIVAETGTKVSFECSDFETLQASMGKYFERNPERKTWKIQAQIIRE